MEPFHTYHHKKGIRFFPPHLPPYVEELIKNRKISVLNSEEINAKEIYLLSADKAVNVNEAVFAYYKKRYDEIFNYVSDTLKSPEAENVFKINLCNRIAEFYSSNILLHRLEECLTSGRMIVYPDMNVYAYLFMKKLLSESKQEFYEHPNIRFPRQAYLTSFVENLKRNLISSAKVLAQTLASGFLGRQSLIKGKKRIFSYGMTIVSPRQLRDNKRGPDFIIDNREILASEVVYLPLIPLTKDQQEILAKLPGEVYWLPKARCFSHFKQWKRLFILGLKQRFLRNGEELMSASNAFLNYFRWQGIMKELSIRHFITHSDFGIGHVGRNLALNQAGVQTWYFTDSANLGVNLEKGEKSITRHPFWSYLCYDHLVTWDGAIAEYYKRHPGSFEETHIVGCLWSEHIRERNKPLGETASGRLKDSDNLYVLSCFDSTYSRNGLTSYEEGIAFAEHLLKLIDECPDICMILKEKKDRSIHCTLDPILGPKLLRTYDRMDSHPRVKICSNRVDASELISMSDIVVSFPFTSTTFEALSSNKPAIWHDPMGYYGDTLYAKVAGVVTHSYDELKEKVLETKDRSIYYKNPIPMNSPLMDPFRDGKAIERFRKLLISS
ncbi:MAG: polysaccharide biosynthesis PFTS motif protein [Thermodesulfobacteriota bacterium]